MQFVKHAIIFIIFPITVFPRGIFKNVQIMRKALNIRTITIHSNTMVYTTLHLKWVGWVVHEGTCFIKSYICISIVYSFYYTVLQIHVHKHTNTHIYVNVFVMFYMLIQICNVIWVSIVSQIFRNIEIFYERYGGNIPPV